MRVRCGTYAVATRLLCLFKQTMQASVLDSSYGEIIMPKKVYARNILQGILFDATKMLDGDGSPKEVCAFLKRRLSRAFVSNNYQKVSWR